MNKGQIIGKIIEEYYPPPQLLIEHLYYLQDLPDNIFNSIATYQNEPILNVFMNTKQIPSYMFSGTPIYFSNKDYDQYASVMKLLGQNLISTLDLISPDKKCLKKQKKNVEIITNKIQENALFLGKIFEQQIENIKLVIEKSPKLKLNCVSWCKS